MTNEHATHNVKFHFKNTNTVSWESSQHKKKYIIFFQDYDFLRSESNCLMHA